MHLTSHADAASHAHVHLDDTHACGEQRTMIVAAINLTMMTVEIIGGLSFNSMALLADGFHMGSHAAALGLAAFACAYARRHARDERFTFGTGKVGALGGFASAPILAMIALIMAWESIGRLLAPAPIDFAQATLVAVVGLAVNIISAVLLTGHHDHDHADHHDDHDHDHHHDHNLRAAYVHVLADALTSVLAIVALVAGRYLGWSWLDPVMGIVGTGVILWWSYGLLRNTTKVLLDAEGMPRVRAEIRRAVEGDADNLVSDLHVWRVGTRQLAAIISVTTHHPRPPGHDEALLGGLDELAHVTVEVNPCPGAVCRAA